MKQEGVLPDAVTFVGVLSACSHGGLVDEGLEYFNSMCEDHGITPVDAHYGCIVDLFGRGGHLHQAEDFIRKIPIEATSGIWGTLLGACRIYGNVELAECAANHCLKLDPENAAVYVTLSHIYAGAGMWDSVAHVENTMKERGIKKETGRCWVEVEKKVHTFVAEDRTHSQTPEIYAALADELCR
jgi:pentatricopeptide repeat protein